MVRRLTLVGVMVCLLSRVALAETKDTNYWSDAGYGTLAVMANVFYMPTKVVYATLGTVTGALAYILTVGNADIAQGIWSPSVGGSYVVTPAMVRGDEPILFNGTSFSKD